MKQEVIGILAHVDSGKTTLCEALLYKTGEIRKIGRVDHKDAFLDTHKIERSRGITIFSKQAVLDIGKTSVTLLDTPGHIDFGAEAERTLSVLDYAILVISGTDGVQSHTETLWKLLKHYNVPVFLFINKMDLEGSDKEKLILNLKEKLDDACISFTGNNDFFEEIALCDNSLMNSYLENENITDDEISDAIKKRKVFPCYFGSALKLYGIDEFLDGIDKYTKENNYKNEFGAKVYKISDDNGTRLTHLKICGGCLKVRDIIDDEKITQIRIYSGEKYNAVNEAKSGSVCAVAGLTKTYAGQGIGIESSSLDAYLEPFMTYKAKINSDIDQFCALENFKRLEAEDPQLHIIWNDTLKEIHVQIMGKVQLEVLKQITLDRFNMDIDFDRGSIAYKETIKDKTIGIGHYEPLRHYAEVHLLIEPQKRGSGIKICSDCREDDLDRNWQRLILTHLNEKTHLGVLTGSPITDVKITLVAGRAHLKHTEGGDFRQATYRAVRQGLKSCESVLLEPWYNFRIEVPTECVGRVMTDIQKMNGTFSQPKVKGDLSVISGSAPVKYLQDYNVLQFTGGMGKISCTPKGYDICVNPDEVIAEIGYNFDADIENTADSVFCQHGAGFNVKWDEVPKYAHIDSNLDDEEDEEITEKTVENYISRVASDSELLKIFEMTYGPVKTDRRYSMHRDKKVENNEKKTKAQPQKTGPEYLLVDGYNIIFAWDDLKKLADKSLDLARNRLINIMCNYQAFKRCNLILVFDAYKVAGYEREIERVHNIDIVYTKEAETADMYIEKVSNELSKNHRVRVATSDRLEQLIILGNGAFKISAQEFYKDVSEVEQAIKSYLKKE